jgi:hypothetical protein
LGKSAVNISILYLQCIFSYAAGATNLKPNIEQRQQAADEFAGKLKGVIEGMKARGLTQRAMCEELNKLGVPTARGGRWSQIQLQRVMARF